MALSLLGTMRYKDKYQGDAPNQKPNFAPDSILVPETGKRIGGRFLQYWVNNGSLTQFGNPISDEIQEISELDGQTYTMQYFERAVMEWHPNYEPPYDVQLSPLGRFRHDTLYGFSAQVPPSARALSKDNSTYEPLNVTSPIVLGHEILYLNTDETNISICSYDLRTSHETILVKIPFAPGRVLRFAADENTIVWLQDRTSIHIYDRASGIERVVLQVGVVRLQEDSELALDKNVLYYTDFNSDHKGLYRYDIVSQQETLISNSGSRPVAKDGILLYTSVDELLGPGVHLQIIKDSKQSTIATSQWTGFASYDITSKYAAWSFGIGAQDRKLYLLDLQTQSKIWISSSAGRILINGNQVISKPGTYMIHNAPSGGRIITYDISTTSTSILVTKEEYDPELCGLIDDQWLIYARYANYNQTTKYYEQLLYAVPLHP